MALPKWNKKDLEWMSNDGYKIVPCKDEEEALEVKRVLKVNNRCAQAGRYITESGKEKYFVCTRERK